MGYDKIKSLNKIRKGFEINLNYKIILMKFWHFFYFIDWETNSSNISRKNKELWKPN